MNEDYMGRIAARMKITANRFPWNGLADDQGMTTMDLCRRQDKKTGSSLLFTLDFNHHNSGWWKNPDYERCYHLSIASLAMLFDQYGSPFAEQIPELTKAVREQWAKAFFGDNTRLLWIEPPVSAHGKSVDSWHYRLFVSKEAVPLLPRGEVYSRELTEAGWKSWSEVHDGE